MSALAGIDIALWDLKGKQIKVCNSFLCANIMQHGGWEFPFTNCLVEKSVRRSKSTLGLGEIDPEML